MNLTPSELRAVVLALPANCPITDDYEHPRTSKAWYSTQKEHLLGWLAEYNGPGAYGRKNHDRDARAFYQHFRCVAGLLWLAEALGEDTDLLQSAVRAIEDSGTNPSSQCAAFRRAVPWERIEVLVAVHQSRQRTTVKARLRAAVRIMRPLALPH